MTSKTNLMAVNALNFDYLGFIFYEKSKRGINKQEFSTELIQSLNTDKVGVFVNATLEDILDKKECFQLNLVQLHGDETVDFCLSVQAHLPIIKVFKVGPIFDFSQCQAFDFADYFLFDTSGQEAGGNGIKFDWSQLENYQMEVPFFLSGGIRMEDVNQIKQFNHPQCIGIDVNSGFEIQAGLKNIELLKQLKNELSGR